MLSPEEMAAYNDIAEFTLVHSYTRVVVNSSTDDSWKMATSVDGTTTSGILCNYLSTQNLITRSGNVLTIKTPTLRVKVGDTIKIGDKVTNILDSSGSVIEAGPLYVEEIEIAVGFGVGTLKTVTFRAVNVERW